MKVSHSFLIGCIALFALACSDGNDSTTPPVSPLEKTKFITEININNLAKDSAIIKIDTAAGTAFISVPFDYDYKAIPINILHTGSSISPAAGTQDFSKPVNYVITALNSSKKTYIITVTRREQLFPSNVRYNNTYVSTYCCNARWGDTLKVYANNFITKLKEDNGSPFKHDVYLINNDTKSEIKLTSTLTRLINPLDGFGGMGLKVIIPDDLPVGFYTVKAGALNKITTSKDNAIQVELPNPKALEYPLTMKVGDVVEIKGKYFTNIPRGTTTTPRVRLTMSSNLGTYSTEEFEIISFTETSITAKVKGFTDSNAYIIAGSPRLLLYAPLGGYFTGDYVKSVRLNQ